MEVYNSHQNGQTLTHIVISGAKTDSSLLLKPSTTHILTHTHSGDMSSLLSHCQIIMKRQRKMDGGIIENQECYRVGERCKKKKE